MLFDLFLFLSLSLPSSPLLHPHLCTKAIDTRSTLGGEVGRRVTHVAASGVAGRDHCRVHGAHTGTDGRVLANGRWWCIVEAARVARANCHACWGEGEEGGAEGGEGRKGKREGQREEKGGRGGGGERTREKRRERKRAGIESKCHKTSKWSSFCFWY